MVVDDGWGAPPVSRILSSGPIGLVVFSALKVRALNSSHVVPVLAACQLLADAISNVAAIAVRSGAEDNGLDVVGVDAMLACRSSAHQLSGPRSERLVGRLGPTSLISPC